MTQSKKVVGPVFYWMIIEDGTLWEIEGEHRFAGINGYRGHSSKEGAISAYADYVTHFGWSAPEELVLTERYRRDVNG